MVSNGSDCDHAGHEWADAGGGLEICVVCQAEQWTRRPPRTDDFGDPMPDAYSTFWKG